MTKKHTLAKKLLSGITALKNGKGNSIIWPSHSAITTLRKKLNLSQAQFAKTIGISVKTLQDWEQARRKPSRSAKSLLLLAEKHPEIFKKISKNNRY